jgi:hypothetical protein
MLWRHGFSRAKETSCIQEFSPLKALGSWERADGPDYLPRLMHMAGFLLMGRWCGRVDSNHHGIATASPSSWCVCQFRHDRKS